MTPEWEQPRAGEVWWDQENRFLYLVLEVNGSVCLALVLTDCMRFVQGNLHKWSLRSVKLDRRVV